MKTKNNSSNPNFQKIITKISKNTTDTRDLLDFEFINEDGEDIRVNEIFDLVYKLKKNSRNQNDINSKLATSIEALSEQVLRTQLDLEKKIAELEEKTKYL
nr:MAG TPA: hypothetical protein [Caudoviricetes sp.]